MDENNNNIVQEILHDLFSSLEALETQNTAILRFLKDKGIVTDEELASHLEQAGNASSVRWRGVRVRADYLFASAIKAAEQAAEKESPKSSETEQESKPATKQTDKKETTKSAQPLATTTKSENDKAEKEKPEADEAGARAEQTVEKDVDKDRNQKVDADNRPRKNDTEQAA